MYSCTLLLASRLLPSHQPGLRQGVRGVINETALRPSKLGMRQLDPIVASTPLLGRAHNSRDRAAAMYGCEAPTPSNAASPHGTNKSGVKLNFSTNGSKSGGKQVSAVLSTSKRGAARFHVHCSPRV